MKFLQAGGQRFEAIVLKVTERDGLGRVRGVELVYDHETVDLKDPANREFLVAYIKAGVLQAVNTQPAVSTPKKKN